MRNALLSNYIDGHEPESAWESKFHDLHWLVWKFLDKGFRGTEQEQLEHFEKVVRMNYPRVEK